MNIVCVSGRLVRDALLNGNDEVKVLRFLVLAKHGWDKENEEARQGILPCKLFQPSEKLITFLTEKGQGVLVELSGRIQSSRYEKDGETKYSTEIVVNPGGLDIVSFPKREEA